ncbi:hypothetical protein [Nocardia sputi]|uniref:hypothetical protein n=1 Tax=Nocardia sputi TaxID=2943705 RepID=UPI0020BEC9AE|nr:hypothetical protein [Nocardia sputi]
MLEPSALAGFESRTLIAIQIVDGAPRLRVVTEEVPSPDIAGSLSEHGPAESALPQREPLLELLESDTNTPGEIVEFLSARSTPTGLVTGTGEPSMFRQARLTVTDPAAVRQALDEHYEPVGGADQWAWLDEESTVLGEPRLDSGELVVDAISERRFDTLFDAVYKLAPTAEHATVRRTPPADALADHGTTRILFPQMASRRMTHMSPRCWTPASVTTRTGGSTRPSPRWTAGHPAPRSPTRPAATT